MLLDADLTKHYGSVEALRGASFQAHAGEVTALIGDNGAGKSTLVKCLSGAEQPTSGRILLDGSEVQLDSSVTARRPGIDTVYQDLAVSPELDPAANLFLGREIHRKGFLGKIGMLDKAEMRRQAVEEFQRLGVTLQSTSVPIGSLSGIAVVLISHNMPEVLRLGKRVARFAGAATKLEDLVAAMTGALVQEEAA
ncbi:ATP-binding cassette domain-containing protein [Amycolatopsis sp. NPDC050768]|uniref:ATP-binding cassette domain-containing protein n=1 Tax=Amycolatopsis sp. NPDC050768 TaxID=3154839 RepID=UPI0034040A13